MFSTTDDNLLKARTRDLADQCDRRHAPSQTCFLTPADLSVVRAEAKRACVRFKISGGYETAERKILVFLPEYLAEDEPDWNDYMHVLNLTAAGGGLDHRDYLGAALALGIKRDQIGDILVSDTFARMIVLSGISNLLSMQLERIGSTSVTITKETLSDIIPPVSQLITVHGNVSSLRLDNVLSEGFSLPRSVACEQIRRGQVHLNWVPEQRPDHILKPGDLISLRGYGRLKLISIDGKSRKDRFFITMEKT